MANAILAFPRQLTRAHDLANTSVSILPQSETAIPALQLWRKLPADAFGAAERAALQTLIGLAHPLGVAHWPEALAGDDAAAVSMALTLCGVDVLDSHRHDLVLSMLLWHALNGSAAARTTLAFTLDRRRYLGEDVDALARSWRGRSRAAIRRAAVQALVEALS